MQSFQKLAISAACFGSKAFSGLFLACLMCGCLQTSITPEPISLEIARLASANSKEILLDTRTQLSAGQTSLSSGNQFLLLVLPFGKVVLTDPSLHLEELATRELALKGFKPLLLREANEVDSRALRLQVELEDLSLNAFDLIVTRRVACDLAMSATLYNPLSGELKTAKARVSSARFRRFGFAAQLERELHLGFNKAFLQLMEQLGL